MTTVYFIRHGQSLGNLYGRFLGQTDLDLSELGYRQAAATAEYFKDIPIDAVYSSDLKRAFNTVSPLAVTKGLQVIPSTELREIACGRWENMEFDRLRTEFAEDYYIWLSDIGNATCTEGESVAHLQQRVRKEIERIVAVNEGKRVVIGTHATPIRTMTCIWRGLPISEMKNIGWVPNASVTKVIYKNGIGTIEQYGIDNHLEGIRSAFTHNKV